MDAASRYHFPEYSTEYFKQLTAEQLVTRIVKGYPKREWQKIRDRNEALDCRVYARAAAIALGLDRWSESKLEQISGKSSRKMQPEASEKEYRHEQNTLISVKNEPKQRPKIIRSSWL